MFHNLCCAHDFSLFAYVFAVHLCLCVSAVYFLFLLVEVDEPGKNRENVMSEKVILFPTAHCHFAIVTETTRKKNKADLFIKVFISAHGFRHKVTSSSFCAIAFARLTAAT